jgi:hypothetical protein
MPDNFAVDILIPDPPCDELCELRTEVQNQYAFVLQCIGGIARGLRAFGVVGLRTVHTKHTMV